MRKNSISKKTKLLFEPLLNAVYSKQVIIFSSTKKIHTIIKK